MATISRALFLLLGAAMAAIGQGQTSFSKCDVNQYGTTNVSDVQAEISEALGVTMATNDLTGEGVVNVVDVDWVITAALDMGCAADPAVTQPLPPGVSGPLITSLPPAAAVVRKPMQYRVVASSATPASLMYSLSAAPAGMTIGSNNGILLWTPVASQA